MFIMPRGYKKKLDQRAWISQSLRVIIDTLAGLFVDEDADDVVSSERFFLSGTAVVASVSVGLSDLSGLDRET